MGGGSGQCVLGCRLLHVPAKHKHSDGLFHACMQNAPSSCSTTAWQKTPVRLQLLAQYRAGCSYNFILHSMLCAHPQACVVTSTYTSTTLLTSTVRRSRYAALVCSTTCLLALHPLQTIVALMQIMIAEPGSRRKGIAREALTIMMAYAAEHLVRDKCKLHCWQAPASLVLPLKHWSCTAGHSEVCGEDW